MTIREIRNRLGDTQREFAARYHIPFRTIQNWEAGIRKPPEYVRCCQPEVHCAAKVRSEKKKSSEEE